MRLIISLIFLETLFIFSGAYAQRYAARNHQVNQSHGAKLKPVGNFPEHSPYVKISQMGDFQLIESNGIPNHKVGTFPNSGNPHAISPQSYSFKVKQKPKYSNRIVRLEMHTNFGVAVNGIPFDPAAAEWYQGQRDSVWQYEALSGALPLGVDENHAHVQPSGAYHYHGLPVELLKKIDIKKNRTSSPVGWAADGFPIFALYDSKGRELSSSYRLKKGSRPKSSLDPGGKYDGTFVSDYEYVKGQGDLDECNGKKISAENSSGTEYAYFLTRSFPVIPRCFRGIPDESFKKQKRSSRHHHPRRPPPRRR